MVSLSVLPALSTVSICPFSWICLSYLLSLSALSVESLFCLVCLSSSLVFHNLLSVESFCPVCWVYIFFRLNLSVLVSWVYLSCMLSLLSLFAFSVVSNCPDWCVYLSFWYITISCLLQALPPLSFISAVCPGSVLYPNSLSYSIHFPGALMFYPCLFYPSDNVWRSRCADAPQCAHISIDFTPSWITPPI